MKKLILLTTIVLFACELPPMQEEQQSQQDYSSYISNRYVCNCEQKKRLQEFLENNIKSIGNMYNGDDMDETILQLESTGVRAICIEKPVWIYNYGMVDLKKQKPEDSCTTYYNY